MLVHRETIGAGDKLSIFPVYHPAQHAFPVALFETFFAEVHVAHFAGPQEIFSGFIVNIKFISTICLVKPQGAVSWLVGWQ